MDPVEIEGAAEHGVIVLGLLADLGVAICFGKRPGWRTVCVFWLLCVGSAVPLWADFPHLFDTSPGWAVLTSGLWILFAVATVAVSAASVLRSVASPRV